MTTEQIEYFQAAARWQERRRIVGIVLAEYAARKLAGDEQTARVLDALALDIEKGRRGRNNQAVKTGPMSSNPSAPTGL